MPTNYPTKTDRRMTTDEQRAAIAATAKRHGIPKAVSQHGRPYATVYTICKRLGITPANARIMS